MQREKRFNRKLLIELGAVIIILFLIAIVINSCSIFHGSSYRFKQRQLKTAEYILSALGNTFEAREGEDGRVPFQWYLDFWVDHYEDMDPARHSANDLLTELRDVYSELGYQTVMDMSEEDIENLPYETQLTLAELNYIISDQIYDLDLSDYGMEVEDYSLRTFIFTDETEGIVIFETTDDDLQQDTDDEEKTPPSYSLGKKITFDPDMHPVAKKALETGEFQKTSETSFSIADGQATLNYYVPIKDNSGNKGLVQLSLDYTKNIASIWKNAVQVEVVNFFVLLAAAILILVVVNFAAVRPLRKIQGNVMDYKENKDSDKIAENTQKLKSRNEFGLLASDIVSLAVEMNRYIDEVSHLSGERERKNTELSIARTIQMQNLPNAFPAFPDRDDFDIFASMSPAQEVGGDFYDYFLIDDDHLALVIADVADKGVPAALFMMMAKTRLNATALSEPSHNPAEILKKTNRLLSEKNDTAMFVTVWLGVLTVSTGELITANAGHEDPMICTDGSFSLCEEKHGLPLGLVSDQEYEENRWKLDKGDMVFVYTDGVVEAFDRSEIQFGTDRLLAALNTNKDEKLQDILSAVKTAVDDHSGTKGGFDDITMLALRMG